MNGTMEILVPADEADAKVARYGRCDGFPFSAVLRVGEVITGMRFEIRHLERRAGETNFERLLGPELEKLAEGGEINVSINDTSSTLTIYEIQDGLDDQRAWTLLGLLAEKLAELGFAAGEGCHYCGGQQKGNVVFHSGRVGQICHSCLEARARQLIRRQSFGIRSAGKILGTVLLGVAAVAGAWFLFWWCVDSFLLWTGPIRIPKAVLILFPVIVGSSFGAVALRIANRIVIGKPRVIGICAAVAIVLGIASGEIGSAAWLIYSKLHVVSLHAAYVLYPTLLKHADGSYACAKLIALCSALILPLSNRDTRKVALDL